MTTEMPSHEIRCEKEGSESTAQELGSRLRKFNEERAGPLNWKPLVLSIRNSNDELIAGLSGGFFWNTLFVDILWVDEAHRGKACGSSLLRYAEREASERGYDLVYLSSFGFQAPDFYLRQGYSLVGNLNGLPRGSKRQWFAKRVRKSVV
jgi:GNAT superfamily N-acetyltransferase